MIVKNNIEYYLYEELNDEAIQALRKQILDNSEKTGYKYMGDINRVNFSKPQIGNYLKECGYKVRRIQIDNVKKYYYYKQNDI